MLFLPEILTWIFSQVLLSSQRFLVDTGASISVFSQTASSPSAPLSKTKLLTVSSFPLPCFGALVLYDLVLSTSPALSS